MPWRRAVFILMTATLCRAAAGELRAALPSYGAIAGEIDGARNLREPTLAPILRSSLPREIAGMRREDFAAAAFAVDAKCRRFAVVFRSASEPAWERLWRLTAPHLVPAPNAGAGVYSFQNVGRDLRRGRFAVCGDRGGALYLNCPEHFRRDAGGIPAELQRIFPSDKLAAVAGLPRLKGDPFRSIRRFRAWVEPIPGGRFRLAGDARFDQPVHASFGKFALTGIFALWLQEYLNLPPEAASELISRVRMRQREAEIRFEFSDFEYLGQLMRAQLEPR